MLPPYFIILLKIIKIPAPTILPIPSKTKSFKSKSFFNVKNSWGDIGPNHGFINVSEGYFAINTISLIVPKAALSKAVLEKLKMK